MVSKTCPLYIFCFVCSVFASGHWSCASLGRNIRNVAVHHLYYSVPGGTLKRREGHILFANRYLSVESAVTGCYREDNIIHF